MHQFESSLDILFPVVGVVDLVGQDDHGHHVLEEAPPAGLGAVDGLAVVDRVVHGYVPERK